MSFNSFAIIFWKGPSCVLERTNLRLRTELSLKKIKNHRVASLPTILPPTWSYKKRSFMYRCLCLYDIKRCLFLMNVYIYYIYSYMHIVQCTWPTQYTRLDILPWRKISRRPIFHVFPFIWIGENKIGEIYKTCHSSLTIKNFDLKFLYNHHQYSILHRGL